MHRTSISPGRFIIEISQTLRSKRPESKTLYVRYAYTLYSGGFEGHLMVDDESVTRV